MLVLLLLTTLNVSSNIRLRSTDEKIASAPNHYEANHRVDAGDLPDSRELRQGTHDFVGADKWGDFVVVKNGSMEVVIGINNANPNSHERIRHILAESRGTLVDTVSVKNETIAFVANISVATALTFEEKVRNSGLSKYIEPNLRFQASFLPNDPCWSQQWGPAKIQADYAWNTTEGQHSVLVAVVDTGIDWAHPDLTANYVALGYDWVNNDADPMDDNGHGTHCAGILAATLNNQLGIAGLAQVRLMAEKGLDDWGSGAEDDLANAIIHAADQGANIITCSWGNNVPSLLIQEAIQYAYQTGAVLIAAAGNDNTERRFYPAAYDEVVAVSATDQNDNPAGFTNFGDWTELAAPGVDIYSTITSGSYAYKSGTSMACPHVAGVAALTWSRFPDATRDWVRLWLRHTADDLGNIGFDDYYGYGRTNARRAVEENQPTHDVVVAGCQRQPYIESGSQGWVATTLVNFGAQDETGLTLQLLVNGSVVNSVAVDFLETRKSAFVNCSWTPTVEGIYNVTSYVVPVQNEVTTGNNALSRYVFVGIKTIEVPTLCPTIQDAIDSAGSNFTVFVHFGTYYENLVVDKSLSLVGENKETTVIDASETGSAITIVATNVNIANFTIRDSGTNWYDSGILLYSSHDGTICNNSMTHNNFGLYIAACFNYTFAHNNVSGNAHFGFLTELSFNCTFLDNFVTYNFDGIILDSCSQMTLRRNTVRDCFEGIVLLSSPNCALYGNNVSNSSNGLCVHYSPSSQLRNNILVGTGWRCYNLDVWGGSLSDFIQDIDTSNTVNGEPIYYWINKQCQTVPSDAGYVAVINSTGVTIKDLSLRNSGVGVLLAYANDSIVTNNNIVNNEYAIQLSNSFGSLVYGNNIIEAEAGISLDASSSSLLFENNVTNVFREWGILVNAQSCDNLVYRNTVKDTSSDGVMIFYGSKNNSVFENYVINSDLYAVDVRYSSSGNLIHSNNLMGNFKSIRLQDSSNNIIFHNNFIDYSFGPEVGAEANIWDDGYPSGGNFWSNYTGVDVYSGPNQNQLGSDGIGDTPYVIDVANRDKYPLMNGYVFGDIDYDGIVNVRDLHALGKAYMSIPNSLNWIARADLNDDEVIDNADLSILRSRFGKIAPLR